MKRHISFPLLTLTFFIFFLSGRTAKAQDDNILSLRLMTFNIRHGAGMDDVIDLDRQAAVITDAMPDVVGLQEVDSCVKRSGYKPQAKLLGTKTGMHATFGGAIPLTGGKYGVAILSKEAPMSVRNIPLPGTEKRTLLVCEFQEFVFATTHLDLDEECRLSSLPIIIEEAERWGDKPFFICGDWNDTPSSTLIKNMRKEQFYFLNGIVNANSNYTFPATSPNRIIDYIASYGKKYKAIKKRTVINEPNASDHRPVLVEITLESYTTGIQDINNWTIGQSDNCEGMQSSNSEIYDLSGREMPSGTLPRGLYIQKNNRRKVLVK